jgi:hypothetical protein
MDLRFRIKHGCREARAGGLKGAAALAKAVISRKL